MLIVRLLSLLGFGISAFLLWMKLTGRITSVVGCGGSGGCANVLGSQWSQWMMIPVSAISAIFYLGILTLTFKLSKPLLTMAAYLLIAAAMWFMGLQAFVIKSFCPWCFATHLVGVVTAGVILWKARAPFRPGFLAVPLVLMAGLVLGQVFGPKPKTYEVTTENGLEGRGEVKAQNEGQGRLITFKNPAGKIAKSYRLGSVPLIGSPEAKHFIVKYYDYTCGSCRTMEEHLTLLLQKYPEDLAIIVLPTPLNRACNPYLREDIEDHQHACELARLGLAAWLAQPGSFEKAHEILFQRPVHSEASAKSELQQLIPAEKLDAALKDPWVEEMLKSNLLDYQALSSNNIYMPKLMFAGTKTSHGTFRSAEDLIKLMEKEFNLR